MRRADLLVLMLLVPGVALGQPGSATERKRRQIEKQLGLPPGRAPVPADAAPAPEPVPAAPGPLPGAERPAARAVTVFAGGVHATVLAGCRSCHAPGGSAAATRLSLGGNARADHAVVRKLVDLARPRASLLLTKGAGDQHGGASVFPRGSRQNQLILAWIGDGALLEPPPDTVAVAVPAPRRRRSVVPAPATAPPAPAPGVPAAVPSVPVPAPVVVTAAPPAPDFTSVVHPLLAGACLSCHSVAGSAAATRLRLTGAPLADLEVARAFADPGQPERSPLIAKATGEAHGGGALFPVGSPPYRTLLAWIVGGAPASGAPSVGSSPAASPAPAAALPAAAAVPPPPPAPVAVPHAAGLPLPLGFQLDGRFDLNYERRSLGRDTGWAGGKSALRSYHQLLFLSRQEADFPLGLNVEVIGLQLWEGTYGHRFADVPLALVVRAGKILVPFGAEPLMHQLYGGLAGFDQRVLPPIWAQEGIAAQLVWRSGELSLSSDLFAARGYRLKQEDATLNLQSDFAPSDEVKLGAGHRLGAAWGRVSAWYSLYVNPLGAGRRLVMQAIDLGVWRMRQLPVLGRFSAALGFLRADVSGGGAGRDYYHFASYWQGRLHATDWLYLQYRQGLRTFGNKRGVVVDDTRLDASDGSTHTVGGVARWRGLSGGVHYFWNLEKADEVDDDFLRVTVAYDF